MNDQGSRAVRTLEEAAAAVHRLSALVAGGLSLDRALDLSPIEAVRPSSRSSEEPRTARAGAAAAPLDRVRSLVGATLEVARETGAPVAPALERLAAMLRDEAAQERAVQAALAGPRSTARLVALLPVVGMGFGLALGLDPLGVMLAGGIGTVSMCAGALLLGVAWWWSRAIVRSASRSAGAAGLRPELVAVALAGGGAPTSAAALIERAADAHGIALGDARATAQVLELSAVAGVPVRGLLIAEAQAARLRARLDGEARAARAAVQLSLPLGLCVLPAFVLLAVVPLVLSMMQGALAPLG